MRRVRLAASCVLALLLLALASSRAEAQQLFITSAQIENGQLVIRGSTFTNGMRVYLFAGPIELPVISLNSGEIRTQPPPASTPAGLYMLLIYHPTTAQLGFVHYTVGATGPPGPKGDTGVAGTSTGPPGSTRSPGSPGCNWTAGRNGPTRAPGECDAAATAAAVFVESGFGAVQPDEIFRVLHGASRSIRLCNS